MDESRSISAAEVTVRLSVRARILSWLYGVLMPLVCFGVSATTNDFLLDQPWQSGGIDMYATMLLRRSAWIPFVPWLILSMCSLSWWTYQPLAANRLWVRLGLYTGAVLSIQYLVVVVLCTSIITLCTTLFVLPSVFAISLIFTSMVSHFKRFHIWHLMWLMTLVAVVAAAISTMPTDAFQFVLVVPFFVLASGPTLNLIAYLRAAWIVSSIDRAGRRPPYQLLAMLGGWACGWWTSWHFAVQAMLDEYSRLPVNNPNCYFANAAAHAHPWVGGSRQVSHSLHMRGSSHSDRSSKSTPAMKRLKFLELALLATAPHWHRVIRRHYDRWGAPAARFCGRHVWFADLTCILLKPVEAMAEIVRIAAGVSCGRIAAIYEPWPPHPSQSIVSPENGTGRGEGAVWVQ